MDGVLKVVKKGGVKDGRYLYRDIARTFPVQKSCAAFFDGNGSCLFTFLR